MNGIAEDPLNRPEEDLKRELGEWRMSMDDFIKELKKKWGSDWESHFPYRPIPTKGK